MLMRSVVVGALVVAGAGQSHAQQLPADSTRPRRGAEIAIPIASFFLPGFGQYMHGATGTGLAYSAAFVGGFVAGSQRPSLPDSVDFPRDAEDQLSELGWTVAMSAANLSAWDAFNRALPAQRAAGKYAFLGKRETLGQLLAAPFDPSHLRSWTTWVDLAQTALITGFVLSERESGKGYEPFLGRDAAWAGAISMNAAVGEEAMFRGYLLPMIYQKSGKFWVANVSQAAIFGALHGPAGLLFQGPWGLWEGWVTRRNNWSVRESVFHHFWYDAAVFTAGMIIDEKRIGIHRIGLTNIPF
jgi:membrane protease YdiL (CAAX protease family)